MNAVWNSYGQLCGCPEIFKKSCKFFCRELDIRVSEIMEANAPQAVCIQQLRKLLRHIMRLDEVSHLVDADITGELLMV